MQDPTLHGRPDVDKNSLDGAHCLHTRGSARRTPRTLLAPYGVLARVALAGMSRRETLADRAKAHDERALLGWSHCTRVTEALDSSYRHVIGTQARVFPTRSSLCHRWRTRRDAWVPRLDGHYESLPAGARGRDDTPLAR